MDSSPHSFVLDDTKNTAKPLPSTMVKKREKINQIDYYPKFEVEFFDVVKDCAKMIDRLVDVDERIKHTKRLNKIFVMRDKMLLMQMFRDLVMKPIKDIKQ